MQFGMIDTDASHWTMQVARDQAIAKPIPAAALKGQFTSRDEARFANQARFAMPQEFGCHAVAEKLPQSAK